MNYSISDGDGISLRRLEPGDVELMMEWMRDRAVNSYFSVDFEHMSREEVLSFIENSYTDTNQNLAFVNEKNEYLGTITLKHIGEFGNSGEYAIVSRAAVHGTGAASHATSLLLDYAFSKLNLDEVYLNVLTDNDHAISFYRKFGFESDPSRAKREVPVHDEIKVVEWYSLSRERYESMK